MIDAEIDHDNAYMKSKAISDVYSSNEPQILLDRRIKFCMNLYNAAQKALEFPP